MKKGTILKHRSGRLFEFIRTRPGFFASPPVAVLRNTKTDQEETFLLKTYL